MARIRSIKPEFCTSEAIAVLSIPCRLHFAMLWTHSDDHGRGADNPRLIKAALWPLDDDVDVEQVERWQQELAAAGRLVRYEVDGRRYFQVVNWDEHQHPQKPKPSPIPAPSEGSAVPVSDEYATQNGSVPSVVGEVEVVVEVGETVAPSSTSLALVSDEPSADDLFDLFWASYPRKVDKPGSKRAFAKALKSATVPEISDGLRAWKAHWTDPEFIPHPKTWLNQQRWNDRPPEPKQAAPKAADTILSWASQ
jgi:hypothetical protein